MVYCAHISSDVFCFSWIWTSGTQKTSSTASSESFSYVSVLDLMYFSWLNICICPISESANCKMFSFALHISQIPPFSLLDNWRYKALLFAFTAAPSELKLKQGRGKLRQDKARLTSLCLHALHTCCKAWGFLLAVAILSYKVASTKMHVKHYAKEHSLLFILFSMITVMSEHAVSYFLIYIWP